MKGLKTKPPKGSIEFDLRGLLKIGDPGSLVEPRFPTELPKPKQPRP